jgi:hypothetical protein
MSAGDLTVSLSVPCMERRVVCNAQCLVTGECG